MRPRLASALLLAAGRRGPGSAPHAVAGRRGLASVLLLAAALLPAGSALAEASAPGSVQAGSSPEDPWESMNRPVFAFNESVDRWVLEPVATGWDTVVPERVQTCIGNFFDNLGMPVRGANDLLQGKPWKAYETAWRIVINSTVGVGGLFDVASHYDVYESDEDFGQTFGVWGVPPGPYWVIPLLGPSTPRDAVGLAAGGSFSLITYFVPLPFYVTVPASAVDVVNERAAVLESVRAEREAAFDFYTFVRSAYLQYRENQVRDRAEDDEELQEDEDLYYLEDDEDLYDLEEDGEDLYHPEEDDDDA